MTFEEKSGKLTLLQTLTDWDERLKKKHECAVIFDRNSKAEDYLELMGMCEKSIKETRAMVEKAIDELEKTSPYLAMILEMRYLYGLSADDTAEILGCSGRWVFLKTKDAIDELKM